jgi:GGDEF domain-containing protein
MAAGWIAKGPDQPAPTDGATPSAAPAAPTGWTPIGPDQASLPALARPHQQPDANAIENTRNILQASRDVLFGHAPSPGDTDKATNYGLLPSIKDSLSDEADKFTSGPSWETLAQSYPHILKAQFQQVGAGYQEARGASQVASAAMQLAALNTLPQAAARVPGNDDGAKIDAMAKDPAVKKAAISVGLDPTVFAHQWSQYAGMTREQQADTAAQAQQTLADGRSNLTAGKSSRLQAWADQTAWAPSDLLNGKLDPWTLKGLAFNTALAVPDMAAVAGAAIGGTAVGGPVGGGAAAGATAAALFAPAQRAGVKNQIDTQVDTLLQKADQVDAQAPVGSKRGLNPVSNDLRQQAANLAASSDKIADTAAFFYAGADAAGALPVASVLSKAPGAQAILNRIIGAGISKTAGGRVASAMIANGAGGLAQAALQKGIETGIVHESQPLSDALKDIAYTGVVSAITAAPIAAAHEAAGAPARAQAQRSLDEDDLLARAQAAANAMGSAQTQPGETYPGYRWNDTTGKYEPTTGNAAAPSNAPRIAGPASGAAPGATEAPSPATNGPSGETNPPNAETTPSKADTYQAKVDALNTAAAKAEKRSDLSLQPEEEGWSVHVNGEPVAQFETAGAAREALAQARKLVGTSTQRNDTSTTPADQSPTQPELKPGNNPVNTGGTNPTQEDALEQTQPIDRRQDSGLRTRVDQMTPEQMKAALLTHELTGIPNRRAYEDSDKKPAQASVDVDSLKWINDNAGHEGGDQMLKAVAQALHEASGGNAYHISGDEFVVQGDTPEQTSAALADAQERLAGATLTFEHPDGRTVQLKGIGISHGTDTTLDGAEAALRGAKAAREQSGLRAARGTQPPGASIGAAQAGVQTEVGHPAGPQEAGAPAEFHAPSGQGSAGPVQHAVVLGQTIEHPAIPTKAQAVAGNYFKPTVQWHGLPIKLENLAGSNRPFTYPNGKPGTRTMRNHYGYFPGHEGADQDGVDAFIGGDSKLAHIVDQLNPSTGAFDEHKVIVGSPDSSTAEKLYRSNYQPDWKGLGAITQVSRDELEHWLHHGDLSKPYAWKAPSKTLEQHLANPETRAELERMAQNAGWADVGGKMIRKELNGGRGNEYEISRTQWIPHEPWFQDLSERLPAKGRGYVEALNAASSGGKISALERRVLTEMAEKASVATTDWRHPLTPEQLDALPRDQQRARLRALEEEEARLEAEAERRAIAAEGRGEAVTAGDDDDIPFAKGQGDLFGHKVQVQNEIAKAREAIERKLGKGKEVPVETGLPDDIFSQSRKQVDISDLVKEGEATYGQVSEPPAGNSRTPARRVQPAAGVPTQLDIFSQSGSAQSKAAVAQLASRAKLAKIGEFRSGFDRIQTWRQAAHILAPIRKSPQEVMAALVVDAMGKPLAVIRHSIGMVDSASVEPWSIAGSFAQVPGAAAVYLAHNHPSANLTQSHADNHITAQLQKLMRGSGIEVKGMLVVTPGSKSASWAVPGDTETVSSVAAAGKTKALVPVMGRTLLAGQSEHVALNQQLRSPSEAPRLLRQIEDSGIESGALLIDNQHRVKGIVPMTREQMLTLRSGNKASSQANLLKLAAEANTKNLIPFGDESAVYNMQRFARAAGMWPMDGMFKGPGGDWISMAGRGDGATDDVFLRRGPTEPYGKNLSVADVHEVIDKILQGFRTKPADVVVVPTVKALQAHPDFAGRNIPNETHALMDPRSGKLFFVADQIHSKEYAASLLAHEYVVHFGLRAAFGSRRSTEYRAILEGVAKAAPSMLREEWEQQFPGQAYKPMSTNQRLIAAEEVLARHSEDYLKDPSSVPGRIRRFIDRLHGLLRDWIRKVLGLPAKFDDLFMRRTLADLESFLRRGGTSPRSETVSEAEPASAQSKDTFFSGLARAVDAAKREKGTGAEWEATLRNMPGVKGEEIAWTGLKDWLEGRGRVSKAEVADYVAAHQVRLGEVTHGTSAKLANLEKLAESYGFKLDRNTSSGLEPVPVSPSAHEQMEAGEIPEDLAQAIFNFDGSPEDDAAPKYQSWATPGGENYRELLLTLDRKPDAIPLTGAENKEFSDLHSKALGISDGNYVRRPEHLSHEETLRYNDLRDRHDAYYAEQSKIRREGFKSQHWDEANVLAHVRFDDRTGPNGERILHVHEVQSDWHQAGRRKGYKDGMPSGPTEGDMAEAREAARTAISANDNLGFDTAGQAAQAILEHADWQQRWGDLPQTDIDTIQRFRDMRVRMQAEGPSQRVPDAPFKTTWPELAMKRMLRMAAERGYDALSWDTGDTNAQRYNMQQVATHIRVEPVGNNSYNMTAYNETSAGKRTVAHETDLTEQKLADYVGKEMAQKAISRRAEGPTIFQGDDLKVGGAGMRGFYDDILPKTMNKVVKKWGSSVGRVALPGPRDQIGTWEYRGPSYNPDELLDTIKKDSMLTAALTEQLQAVRLAMIGGQSFPEAMERLGSIALAEHMGGKLVDRPEPIQAHSVKITPAMRDSVLEGQPMFKRKPPGPPQPPKRPGPLRKGYDLAARGVAAIPGNEFSLSLRRIADPENISSSSKATALVARESLGELAQASEEALKNLERYAKQFDLLSHSDRMEFIYAIEEGQEQPNQAHQPAADAMRKLMDDWRDKIRDLGIGALDNFIENYFPHVWKDPDGVKKWFGQVFGRRPLKGPASFLKERTIPTTREGIEKGFIPVSTNPLVLVFAKVREMQRFYAGVKLMQRFKDEGLARYFPAMRPIPEGWTKIEDAVGRVRQWSETEQGFIERGFYAMPTDAARVINNHLGGSALRNFLPAQLFRSLTNVVTPMQLSFSGFHLGFTTLDAIVSKNAVGIERLLHGEPIRALKAFLEANSVIGGVAANLHRGNALLKAYSNITGATPEMRRIVEGLMASGGRVKMDNYFAAGQGKSPFRQVGFLNLAHEVKAALTQPENKLMEAAKVMGSFPREYATRLMGDLREMWETQRWPAISVPLEVAGRSVRASTAIIMEHLVPMQKLGVFSDLAADHIRRNPGEDPVAFSAAMQSIWNSVDNRLGEMVYDNVFWNRTFKDVSHMSVRAVGWNLGTIRELGGAPIDVVKTLDYLARGAPAEDVAPDLNGGEARIEYERAKHIMDRVADKVGHKIAYTIALIGTTMVLGAITNALFGQKVEELKDYFFPKTGALTKYGTPERITLPSYMKDIYEYADQPFNTLINKANPMFGIIHALSANEDFYGDPTRGDPDAPWWQQLKEGAKYAVKATVPFSIQGAQHFAAAADHPLLKGATYFGATPAPARITSPEQMERYQHSEDQKAYAKKLQRDMRKAVAAGDQVKAAELRSELLQERQKVKETQRDIREDKIRARDATKKISSLIQGKSKTDAVAALHAAGLPAFATLWAALPDQPRPRVAQSLGNFI